MPSSSLPPQRGEGFRKLYPAVDWDNAPVVPSEFEE
jgi:hypothetical protein